MVETLAVITIIGTMAALASPVFIRQMRDSRVNRVAQMVSEMHRVGRTRAIGRGAAVMVRWDASKGTNAKGALYMLEAVTLASGSSMPSPSCLSTNWAKGDPTNRQIDWMDAGSTIYESAQISFFPPLSAASTPYVEICFTPRGRTWYRTAAGNNFVQLAGVPRFDVANIENPARAPRSVFIPPNGVARIAL